MKWGGIYKVSLPKKDVAARVQAEQFRFSKETGWSCFTNSSECLEQTRWSCFTKRVVNVWKKLSEYRVEVKISESFKWKFGLFMEEERGS